MSYVVRKSRATSVISKEHLSPLLDPPDILFQKDTPLLETLNSCNGLLLEGRDATKLTVSTTVLPPSAIIGIAVAGSVMLFGILIMIICYCLRSRWKNPKKKKGARVLDLSDDNEDAPEVPQSNRISPIKLQTRTSYQSSYTNTDTLSKNFKLDNSMSSPQLIDNRFVPPIYSYQAKDVRDSWPLVDWVQPLVTPISVNKHLVVNQADTLNRTSIDASVVTKNGELDLPQRMYLRSGTTLENDDETSTGFSKYSSNSSMDSVEWPLHNRRSASDHHLTQILRSTSQRLRESQQRPISFTNSLMAQRSGAPPTLTPLSPLEDQRGDCREELLDQDDVSSAESVRSSVLNMPSNAPGPTSIGSRIAEFAVKNQNRGSPAQSENSGIDSNSPLEGFVLSISSASNSPMHEISAFEQSQENGTFLIENLKDITHGNDAATMDSLDAKYSPGFPSTSNKSSAYNDVGDNQAYNYSHFLELQSQSMRRANSGQYATSNRSEGLSYPRNNISGKQKQSAKRKSAGSEMPPNPFHWSPRHSWSVALSPSQNCTGKKFLGHKRDRTVRLSHLPQAVSVEVVLEEPENESAPLCTRSQIEMSARYLHRCERPIFSFQTLDNNNLSSTEPPSQSYLALPLNFGQSDSTTSSNASYSPTMSFFDYYSSPDAASLYQPFISEPFESPSPSCKRSRRQGRTFSVDTSKATHLALTHFPPLEFSNSNTPTLQLDDSSSYPLQNSPSSAASKVGSVNRSHTASPSASSIYSPYLPSGPLHNTSVAATVSLLRRMNSEVSINSVVSALTDHSVTSPPRLAMDRRHSSMDRRGDLGSRNYFRIELDTRTPESKQNVKTNSGIVHGVRNCGTVQEQGDDINNGRHVGFGTQLLSHSPPKTPLRGNTPYISSNVISTKEKQEMEDRGIYLGRMSTPLNQSVRHESQMMMPLPQHPSPKSLAKWKDNLGLCDEKGFWRSSAENGDNSRGVITET